MPSQGTKRRHTQQQAAPMLTAAGTGWPFPLDPTLTLMGPLAVLLGGSLWERGPITMEGISPLNAEKETRRKWSCRPGCSTAPVGLASTEHTLTECTPCEYGQVAAGGAGVCLDLIVEDGWTLLFRQTHPFLFTNYQEALWLNANMTASENYSILATLELLRERGRFKFKYINVDRDNAANNKVNTDATRDFS
eukprot:2956912-Rhodomonas_salina.2